MLPFLFALFNNVIYLIHGNWLTCDTVDDACNGTIFFLNPSWKLSDFNIFIWLLLKTSNPILLLNFNDHLSLLSIKLQTSLNYNLKVPSAISLYHVKESFWYLMTIRWFISCFCLTFKRLSQLF